MTKKFRKPDGTVRMTKAEYSTMLDEKGLQNQALSKGRSNRSGRHRSGRTLFKKYWWTGCSERF
jgi:hypothetical protein